MDLEAIRPFVTEGIAKKKLFIGAAPKAIDLPTPFNFTEAVYVVHGLYRYKNDRQRAFKVLFEAIEKDKNGTYGIFADERIQEFTHRVARSYAIKLEKMSIGTETLDELLKSYTF